MPFPQSSQAPALPSFCRFWSLRLAGRLPAGAPTVGYRVVRPPLGRGGWQVRRVRREERARKEERHRTNVSHRALRTASRLCGKLFKPFYEWTEYAELEARVKVKVTRRLRLRLIRLRRAALAVLCLVLAVPALMVANGGTASASSEVCV